MSLVEIFVPSNDVLRAVRDREYRNRWSELNFQEREFKRLLLNAALFLAAWCFAMNVATSEEDDPIAYTLLLVASGAGLSLAGIGTFWAAYNVMALTDWRLPSSKKEKPSSATRTIGVTNGQPLRYDNDNIQIKKKKGGRDAEEREAA